MLALLSLLAVAPVVTFAGGDDAKLAAFLADRLHEPVVILSEPKRVWSKFSYETQTDSSEELRILTRRMDSSKLSPGLLGFGAAGWPHAFYLTQRRDQYKKFGEGVKPAMDGDTVTGKTGRNGVALDQAFPPGFPLRVSWHWFYGDAQLVIEVSKASPEKYLKLVAAAIGATPVKTKDGFLLDFDPAAYKSRAIALLDSLTRRKLEDVLHVQDYAYTTAVLQSIPDTRLKELMVKPDHTEFFPDPLAGSLRVLAVARIKRTFPVDDDRVGRSQSVIDAWNKIQARCDFDKMHVAFYTTGVMAIMVEPKRKEDGFTVF